MEKKHISIERNVSIETKIPINRVESQLVFCSERKYVKLQAHLAENRFFSLPLLCS